MARSARRKSAVKAKKKGAAGKTARRKAVAKKQAKPARRKTARKAKPKGVLAEIGAGIGAVIDTFSEAQRLRRKLEPGMAGDPE